MSPEEILYKYLQIPLTDKVVCESKPQLVQNKIFDETNKFDSIEFVTPTTLSEALALYLKIADHNLIPKTIMFFTSGSNSTANYLRYIHYGVATAALESENNVAVVYNHPMKLKRLRYIVGVNTKNAVTSISLRINNQDLAESVKDLQPAETLNYDSGVLNIDIATGSKLCWKWDTSLSNSGTITIVYLAEIEVY